MLKMPAVKSGQPETNSKKAEKYMSKPIKPKTNNLLEWRKYYERYDKYLIRKRNQGKRHREKFREQEKIRHKNYRFSNRDKLAEKRRIKFSKPENRQKELERLFRYIEKNPFCNISKMERIIKLYERTRSLELCYGI